MSEAQEEPNQILGFPNTDYSDQNSPHIDAEREPSSRDQMRSAARNNKRFDPCLRITNLNRKSHRKRCFHRITITTKLETLNLVQNLGATCFSRRGDGLSCASSCHLSNTIQCSTTVQNCVSFRHGQGDTHEIRTLLDFLRRPCFESSFSTVCRRRNRPSFNTPGLTPTGGLAKVTRRLACGMSTPA